MKALRTRIQVIAAMAAVLAASAHPAAAQTVAKPGAAAAVTVTDNGSSWTLANGIVRAVVNKTSGALESLFYQDMDTMGHDQGAPGVWEEDPSRAPDLKQTITIDPAKNGGERAEVSVAGKTGGTVMLTPSAPGGGTYCDIEIRYALGRGDSGVYTYAIFSHPASYGAMGIGESRYITHLNREAFDWISVDADRNMLECAPTDWGTGVVVHAKEQRIMSKGVYKNSVEHKYSYNAVQYKVPAYGWSSTAKHVGVWFINPTIEYLSGGASKQELDCHFGDNGNPDPIILDYWRGTHYGGGASCNISAGENWSKVIGPIFVYVNSLSEFKTPTAADLATLEATAGNPTVPTAWKDNQTALWRNALNQAKIEKAKWPYDWVSGVDYPHKSERGTVTGQIVLNDPQAASAELPHLTVGLAHPDYAAGGRAGGRGMVDWTHDAKFYEFWNDGTDDGKFTISNVRPGAYTLHAFADGVLGEFAQSNVTVEAGKSLDLGKLEWKPVRYGKQVWEIGYPDRTGGKFYKGDGDNYWLWGWCLRYGDLFPNDITYTIGKSDYHKDWFFEQVPHALSDAWKNPDAKDPLNQRFGWVKAESLTQYPQTDTHGPWSVYGRGRATTWTIRFDSRKDEHGQAALRVALAGADGSGGLAVAVNGQSVGVIATIATNALRYNTDKSVWHEYTLSFDASLLKSGENQMTLTVPAGELTSGVVYDYLRLELDEDAKPGSAAQVSLRGGAPVLGWAPPQLRTADDDLAARVMALYEARDKTLADRLAQGLATGRMAVPGMDGAQRAGPGGAQAMRLAAEGAARLLAADAGPRIAALTFDGWDTHANEGGATGRLAQLLGGLDGAIDALHQGLGPAWASTAVLVVTEFGRTVHINGTIGTDHGTGTVAFLAGGAIKGRRIVADWPGLGEGHLFEGRDLRPTTDLRAVAKGLLIDHIGLPAGRIEDNVFPDSRSATPVRGLIA